MALLGTFPTFVKNVTARTFACQAGSFVTATKHGVTLSLASLPGWRFRRCQNRLSSTLPSSPIFEAIANHDPTSPAIIHSASDRTFSYGSLLQDVADARDNLFAYAEGRPLAGERIAFLAENSYDYVGAQSAP